MSTIKTTETKAALHPAQDPDHRRTGLGGSDMPAIMGQSNYRSPYEVWLEKTGRAEGFAGNAATRLGSQLEEIIASEFAERFEFSLRRSNITAYADRKAHPWAFAHIDRKIVGKPTEALECKSTTIGGEWGEPMTDEIPPPVLIQVHHQIWCEDLDRVYVGRWLLDKFSAWNIEFYLVQRDDEWHELLAEAGDTFWSYVERDTAPPIDYSFPHMADVLQKSLPIDSTKVVTLDERAELLHKSYSYLRERQNACRQAADTVKAELLDLMQDAWVGMLADGTCYRRQKSKRKGYTVEPTDVIDFRHVKNPPKGALQE